MVVQLFLILVNIKLFLEYNIASKDIYSIIMLNVRFLFIAK